MFHYALVVTLGPKPQRASVKHAIAIAGGLTHDGYSAAVKAARNISRHHDVARVTMVRVREDGVGVWRNGRKS